MIYQHWKVLKALCPNSSKKHPADAKAPAAAKEKDVVNDDKGDASAVDDDVVMRGNDIATPADVIVQPLEDDKAGDNDSAQTDATQPSHSYELRSLRRGIKKSNPLTQEELSGKAGNPNKRKKKQIVVGFILSFINFAFV